jgi:hypothetical protein
VRLEAGEQHAGLLFQPTTVLDEVEEYQTFEQELGFGVGLVRWESVEFLQVALDEFEDFIELLEETLR